MGHFKNEFLFLRDFYKVYDTGYGLDTKTSCPTLIENGYVTTEECDELADIFGTGIKSIVTDDERVRLKKMGMSDEMVDGIAGVDNENKLYYRRLAWLKDNIGCGFFGCTYGTANRSEMVRELGEMGDMSTLPLLMGIYFDHDDVLNESPIVVTALAGIAKYYPKGVINRMLEICRSHIYDRPMRVCSLAADVAEEAAKLGYEKPLDHLRASCPTCIRKD